MTLLFKLNLVLLKIEIYDELPQWIISSDRAAYHPATRTIYFKSSCISYKVICHELGHWVIHMLCLPKRLHYILDR